MAKKRMSDEEFNRQYAAAVRRGRERAKGPRVEAVFYDKEDNCIVLEFSTGASVEIPCRLLDELAGASPEEIAEVELSPQGMALHWEDLDIDISVPGAVALAVGPRTWMSAMGSAGGRATSEAKASAARINGAKGGRPPVERSASAGAFSAGKHGAGRVSKGGTSGTSKGGSKR